MRFKVAIDKNRCKGCGLCISFCRHALLKMTNALNVKGFHYPSLKHPEKCTGCTSCAEICPDAAIEIEQLQELAAHPHKINTTAASARREDKA